MMPYRRPKKGSYALTASSIEGTLTSNLRRGDVVMVKASNGTRLGPIVTALKTRFGKDGAAILARDGDIYGGS